MFCANTLNINIGILFRFRDSYNSS